MQLSPLPGRILVEIKSGLANVASPEQKYSMDNQGICIAVNDKDTTEQLIGCRVFWNAAQMTEKYTSSDGKTYTFVKVKELDGYEPASTT